MKQIIIDTVFAKYLSWL